MASINISNLLPWSSQYSSFDGLVSGKVTTLINFAIGFAGLVAVILLVVAGFTYITSAGNADKVEQAGKMITGTIIGLVVVMIAALLVKYILSIVGVS